MDSDDDYIVQEFSDEGGTTDSSVDEDLVMKEFCKSRKKVLIDDFESEMTAELERRVTAHLEKEDFKDPTDTGNDRIQKKNSSGKFDKYFDTDSEEETGNSDNEKVQDEEANSDLLYDPLMDKRDEVYVEKQRDKYRHTMKKSGEKSAVSNSDAVLNCPACFTTLCHDSQRHEVYRTQYRAMFTFNCKVDESETMKISSKPQNARSKKMVLPTNNREFLADDKKETFYPVRCEVCNTHVAMFDSEEVYHFFNVVTSH